ncbi:hypothetical protein PC119_g17211 [Phytophthora cactorum]|uniref:HECT domain-containing protein n=1 Tax=Phytophthora cactorum TaxID=29920 RepID=A0A8T0YPG9_9STRA|nr:hypothetical protein PC113_g16359 [Phytophthora cactorum]KAG2999423.1 hypothetical protein PC119_g17211 [Phytophthora cactorum]KAG3070478.1 hypothetical protein PC122_g16100 [Phytophthora cactorum]
MDMRSKVYPALPDGRGLLLVIPRVGDLRFRPQIPAAFTQRLYIHADPRRRFWYVRFQLRRKFIVMSTQGDLYAKTSVATFTMADLPKQNVLSMPRVARGDLVKVLDLVQCSRSEGQQWELVFTRWRNGMETWLPVEVVQLYASNLLQEFYVNSINSWAFHARLQQGNLSAFRTEVELWLFHPEFQEFYKRLRQKRAGGSTASHPQQQAGNVSDRVPVKPEQTTASVNTSHTPPVPHPTQTAQPPAPVAAAESDPSEAVIREFEQRRLERERQERHEQLARDGQQRLLQLQRQQQQQRQQQRIEEQAERQRRLQREREERERQIQQQERARRLQHEQQRQKAHEELQRSQKDYQQRLRAQQEREKQLELQQQERARQQRAKEQEQLQQRLQQDKSQKNKPAHKQTPTHRSETTTRTQLRHRERQDKSDSHSSSQRSKDKHSSSIWSNGGDDEYVPPEASESEDSDASADSEASEDSLSSRLTRKRRRKRLLYSQVEVDDDDDDDLPDLSQPPPATRRRNTHQGNSDDDTPDGKPMSKKRRRLRQPDSNGGESNSVEVDLTQLSDEEEKTDNSVEALTDHAVTTPVEPLEGDGNESGGGKVISELVEENGDADHDDDMDFEPSILIGEIRCVCGATSVGGYRGQWLQCWKEDCGVWEHADCVGFLTSFETRPPLKYLCSRCDPESYLARCVKASHRILDWLFQCCDSRNSKKLMDLLGDNTGAANLPSDWKNANYENRTLAMHAARNGLVKGLCYLLDVRKVNLFETDLQSRNSLHHAALGGSVACCQILLKRDRKLLLHQDLRGCMPFHLMLQSARVNRLCVPFIREDAALVGMGDLDSNFPIHYACQAINNHTVEICQLILAAQSPMLQEKSSEGFYPLMILCKAAGTATAMRNRAVNASEVCRSTKDIIALMLDIDVFGDCLNQTAPNGWRPLHFAAASGNHELVTHLCNLGMCDVQYAAKESDQTALHIAAHNNDPLCVRALLLEGLNVVAKDTDGWIPMLYAENAACVQEFMHYKLTKQLSRLHRMLGKFQQRELVHRWQRCVARDPICFDILNDWCQSDIERIERMEGLLLSNPFLLRLDNKIDYVWRYIIQSIKNSPGQCSIGVENGKSGPEKQPGQKKLAFSFSRERGCFWKQFVGMGMRLEPEDFRLPMIFSIERGNTNSQGAENREGNLKLVLIRLAAGLLKEVPGLLVRGSKIALEKTPLSSGKEELAALLVGFFVLGELVAHFVLFAVPLSGILDFTASFLRCVGCKGKYRLARDKRWENAGCSFAAGFEAVLPATLELFHADELRLLFNGPETSLNALQIDWNTAVDWNMCGQEIMGDMKTWLPRLMNELVEEEQQLLLLFMTGTFQLVNERFFRSEGSSGRITVESFSETDSVLDHDTMYPTMEHKPDILRLPSYSCYEAFKKGMLGVIRHTDQAFLPE